MRHWFVRLVVVSALLAGTSLAVAFSNGPPVTRTGAPAVGGVAAEGVCTVCHTTFALNLPGATLEILDAPQFYLPDTVYTLRVRMTSTFATPRRWGFQLTAVRQADGQGVGTFDITGIAGLQVLAGSGAYATRRYVEHTSAGTFPNNNGPVEWTFRWRAPNADLGRIFFFAAGNAANNNNANSGDHIYTTRDTTDINPLLDAPVGPLAGLDVLEPARPNPFRGQTAFGFTLAQGGAVDLSVFDAQGRRVRTLLAGDQPAGRGSASWDGRHQDGTPAMSGVYFVRLAAPGMVSPVSRRVVLTR